MADYDWYLDNYFSSPKAYAQEIQRKEASGQQMSDQAAAAAFKSAYSDLFTTPSSTPSSTSTTTTKTTTPQQQPIQQPQQQSTQPQVVYYQQPSYQTDPSIAAAINDLRSSMANMPTINDIMSSPAMQQMQAAIQGQMSDAMRGARADLAARGVLGEGSTPAAERMGQVAGHYGTQLGQLVPQLMSVAQQMGGDRTNALQNLVSILSGLGQQDWQRGMTEFQTYAPYTRLTAGQRAELANMLLMNVPELQGYSPDMIMQWLDTF